MAWYHRCSARGGEEIGELAERCDDCGCDIAAARLREATDDQLYQELARRHGAKFEHARLLSDDQLRAECKRRGMVSPSATIAGFTDDALRDDRDVAVQYNVELLRDRDEWRRRAEAAEQNINDQINAARARTDATLMTERGPGIAALPPPQPEPLAFLDEDLLCDDV